MKKIFRTFTLLFLCMALLAGCFGNPATTSGEPSTYSGEAGVTDDPVETIRDFSNNDDLCYVMIYNPELYDETVENNAKLYTGDFSSYVEAVISRADEFEEEPRTFIPRSVSDNVLGFDVSDIDIGGSRGGSFIVPYKVGDTHDFYCGADQRTKETFVCEYAGTYCNIWSLKGSIDGTQAARIGAEFDNTIYPKDTQMFGKSRFAENGGNVNILFYPLGDYTAGFFHTLDLWASDEITTTEQIMYTVNTDHDIININSNFLAIEDFINVTIAHEFQHLICFTDFFYTLDGIMMKTWLNEAMSGYAEETIYPGAQETFGYFEEFSRSHRIRHGQSLYNFATTTTDSDFDIGVYGSVYLFSEYLAGLAGNDIYTKIHSYWRDSYSNTLTEAEAIAASVPNSVYQTIDNSVSWGDNISFTDDNEEWLSKLTLNFYLSLLQDNVSNPEAFEHIESQTLLYDEINPADIEGGGRVIVSLKNGEFEIPENSDYGLVYIGLDKDFNVVTDYIVY